MIDITAGILKILGTGPQAAIEFYSDAAVIVPTARLYLQADGTLNTDVSGDGDGAGVETHALDGGLHTGTLANVQAPQFVLLDGTRAMTGGLTVPSATVNGNITITGTVDGVDVSDHVALEDVHHNHATIGAGGLSAKLVFTDQVLTLAAIDHADLSNVTADQHHNHATIGAGGLSAKLTYTDQVLTLAAIDHADLSNIVTDQHVAHSGVSISASGLGLAGGGSIAASRTITLSSSNDPGAAAAILASTAAGGLTLQSLALNGSLDITDGDLTVLDGATTVFFVDESAHNVGIMTNTPDSQFALDVDGPIRGQYLIGPHAIQLSDAVMICHFDGSYPFETNYDVDTAGHLGQTATVSGGVIGRPGKFGKAAQVAEADYNYIYNPQAHDDVTNWTPEYTTLTRVTTDVWIGPACFKFSKETGQTGYTAISTTGLISLANGESATLVVRIKIPSGSVATGVKFRIKDNTHNVSYFTDEVTIKNEWITVSSTFANSTGVSVDISIIANIGGTAGPDCYYYFDGVHLNHKAYQTPYLDGSLGDGHSWSSTAHASTSSRTAGSVVFDSLFSDSVETFTITGWVRPCMDRLDITSGSGAGIVDFGNTADSKRSDIWLWPTNGYLSWYDQVGGRLTPIIDYDANDWLWFAATRDGNTITLYVYNYTQDTSDSASDTSTSHSFASTMSVGGYGGGTVYPLNGLLDDFVVLARALSAVEVRAIYESNAPVFAETSIQAWRSPGQVPIWVNEEGMWGRDADGNASLGWSSVDGKSWGGQTLGKGDFLLGYSTEYVLWDSSAATLNIAGGVTAERGAIGGWTITATELANTNIWLDAAALQIAIKSQTFGNDGIQLEYNSGNPRAYIGDGANAYLNFDGTKITWKATNTELDASGNLTATSATLSGAVTATSGELQTLSLTGLLSIAAGGKIRVGTGTKDADLTGWLIDNTEIVGQNGAGTDEVCLTSEGKITAGAGAVTLDENGISVTLSTVYSRARTFSMLNPGGTYIGGVYGTALGNTDIIVIEATNVNTNNYLRLLAPDRVEAIVGTGLDMMYWRLTPGAATSVFSTSARTFSLTGDARVGGGLYVGSTGTDPDTDDIHYEGDLRPVRGGSTYTGYVYVPLTQVKAWDGVAKSIATHNITAATLGIPTTAKAVTIWLSGRWTGTGATYHATARERGTTEIQLRVAPQRADISAHNTGIVNCNANGDIDVTVNGLAATYMWLYVLGYFI